MAKNYDFSFDPSKYEYHVVHGNEVIAITHYHGQTVKAKAKCAPNDEFNLDKGKEIAAARCYLKVCSKRVQDADKRVSQLQEEERKADDALELAYYYFSCAETEKENAQEYIEKVEGELKLNITSPIEKIKKHLTHQCRLIGILPPTIVQDIAGNPNVVYKANWLTPHFDISIVEYDNTDVCSFEIVNIDNGMDEIKAEAKVSESEALQFVKILLKNT